MKLSLALGLPVAETQRRVSSREFAEWMAYDDIEPFGELRGDVRTGLLTAHLVQALVGKTGDSFSAAEFMPDFRRKDEAEDETGGWDRPRKSVDEMRGRIDAAIKAASKRAQGMKDDGRSMLTITDDMIEKKDD